MKRKSRRLLFFLSLLGLAAPQLIPQTRHQAAGFGTIQVTVVRELTSEPIPDVQLILTESSGLTPQQAQALLNAVNRGGGANIPPETLQAARRALRNTELNSIVKGQAE